MSHERMQVGEAAAETPLPPPVAVPEKLQPLDRIAETADPTYPLRAPVRLKDKVQAERLVRFFRRLVA